jgi:hypothetical protein
LPGGVDFGEIGERAVANIVAQVGVGAGERRRLSDYHRGGGDALRRLRLCAHAGKHAYGKRRDVKYLGPHRKKSPSGWILLSGLTSVKAVRSGVL